MTCVCGQPLTGAYLCADCTHALAIAIADIAAHWTDLDNVRAKLTRYGSTGAGDQLPIDPRFARYVWLEVGTSVTSLPALLLWDRCDDPECKVQVEHAHAPQTDTRIPDGTALLDAIRNTVTTWVRVCLDRWPTQLGPACEHHSDLGRATPTCMHTSCWRVRRTKPPADTVPACCRYLLGWTRHIAVVQWAPEILDEMEHLAGQLRMFVDRPADRWYAGPCDACERDLYARTGAAQVTCPECQLDYDVAARRAWLLEQAEDHLVNAATLARAVSWLGDLPLSAERIRKWAERGRIMAKGSETRGPRYLPLYRVGDALDLLAAERLKVG